MEVKKTVPRGRYGFSVSDGLQGGGEGFLLVRRHRDHEMPHPGDKSLEARVVPDRVEPFPSLLRFEGVHIPDGAFYVMVELFHAIFAVIVHWQTKEGLLRTFAEY